MNSDVQRERQSFASYEYKEFGLQRHFEADMQDIFSLEKSKTGLATVLAMSTGKRKCFIIKRQNSNDF